MYVTYLCACLYACVRAGTNVSRVARKSLVRGLRRADLDGVDGGGPDVPTRAVCYKSWWWETSRGFTTAQFVPIVLVSAQFVPIVLMSRGVRVVNVACVLVYIRGRCLCVCARVCVVTVERRYI